MFSSFKLYIEHTLIIDLLRMLLHHITGTGAISSFWENLCSEPFRAVKSMVIAIVFNSVFMSIYSNLQDCASPVC